MSQPAGTIQDGTLKFGSQQVTINAVAYIADNIDYDVATKIITRNDENGVPKAEVQIVEVGTGSCTLQVPSTPGAPPLSTAGNTLLGFTILDVDGVTTIPVKVTKVGRKFVADGETKLPIEFRQRFS